MTPAQQGSRELEVTEYDDARPWGRQPCDTDNRWRCFLTYRELALPRSLARVSKALTDPVTGKPFCLRTLEKWSSEDGWVARVHAYDRHIDKERVAATMAILKEDAQTTAAKHLHLLRKLQTIAVAKAEEYLDDIANGHSLGHVTTAEMRALARDAITLERLVRGQATERVDNAGAVDLSQLSLEDIQQLRELYAKAGAKVG